jgi:hypothetical protein
MCCLLSLYGKQLLQQAWQCPATNTALQLNGNYNINRAAASAAAGSIPYAATQSFLKAGVSRRMHTESRYNF